MTENDDMFNVFSDPGSDDTADPASPADPSTSSANVQRFQLAPILVGVLRAHIVDVKINSKKPSQYILEIQCDQPPFQNADTVAGFYDTAKNGELKALIRVCNALEVPVKHIGDQGDQVEFDPMQLKKKPCRAVFVPYENDADELVESIAKFGGPYEPKGGKKDKPGVTLFRKTVGSGFDYATLKNHGGLLSPT